MQNVFVFSYILLSCYRKSRYNQENQMHLVTLHEIENQDASKFSQRYFDFRLHGLLQHEHFIIGCTLFGIHYKYCILIYCQEQCWRFDVAEVKQKASEHCCWQSVRLNHCYAQDLPFWCVLKWSHVGVFGSYKRKLVTILIDERCLTVQQQRIMKKAVTLLFLLLLSNYIILEC